MLTWRINCRWRHVGHHWLCSIRITTNCTARNKPTHCWPGNRNHPSIIALRICWSRDETAPKLLRHAFLQWICNRRSVCTRLGWCSTWWSFRVVTNPEAEVNTTHTPTTCTTFSPATFLVAWRNFWCYIFNLYFPRKQWTHRKFSTKIRKD